MECLFSQLRSVPETSVPCARRCRLVYFKSWEVISMQKWVMRTRITMSAISGSLLDHQRRNDARFASEQSKEKIPDGQQNKKIVRLLTVIVYVFSVSLAAIILSLYYVFLWDSKISPSTNSTAKGNSVPCICRNSTRH